MSLVTACGGGPRLFRNTTIVWRDLDRRPFRPPPEPRFAPEFWDAADHLVFRPAVAALALETHGESQNVNALDEVPSSSWFENRIGIRPVSRDELALGACDDDSLPEPPWRIISGKRDGASAGFVFEDARGIRFVLKADRPRQPQQASGADAIGAALYHAVGYHVPCNRVVTFDRSWVILDSHAALELPSGRARPMRSDDLEEALEHFGPASQSRLRGLASQALTGQSLGPWDYRGVWDRDLNDVIPHENRRELRAMFVLDAWVDHWDARQHNTLSTWIEHGPAGAGHVEHHVIDLGDSLGFLDDDVRSSTRFGRSRWFDAQHVVEDLLSLGLVVRPWDTAEEGPTWPLFGYLDTSSFDPDAWRPNYWNGALERCTEHDAAWMARIIARFREADVRTLARLGEFSDPDVAERLVHILRYRQRKILERYLTRLSPLTTPTLRGNQLCLVDSTVVAGLRAASTRRHDAWWFGANGELRRALLYHSMGAEACIDLSPIDEPYAIVRVQSGTPQRDAPWPIDVHVATREGERVVLGVERRTDGRLAEPR